MNFKRIAALLGLGFLLSALPALAQYPATATNANGQINVVTPMACMYGCSGGGGGGGAVTGALNSFVDGWSFTTGLTTDTACATDNGTCTSQALWKRNNQRMTSLITALGTPFQAGGSIGNTTFAATQATAANLNATVVGGTTAADASTLTATIKAAAINMCYNGTTADLQKSLNGYTNAQTAGVCVVASLGLQGYAESNAALGSSATYTGAARQPVAWASYFQCKAYADQAGTLRVEESDDSTGSWQKATADVTITAASASAVARIVVTGAPATSFYRCVVVNGAVAQSLVRITSSFTAN